MVTKERFRGNQYRATQVCVDSYQDGVLKGRLYNPVSDAPRPFHSMSQFLVQMEALLDQLQFPQSFRAVRSFAQPPRKLPDAPQADHLPPTGELATFVVRVLFRQNASWQGTVIWRESGQEENFRSALELLLLMDGALQYTRLS